MLALGGAFEWLGVSWVGGGGGCGSYLVPYKLKALKWVIFQGFSFTLLTLLPCLLFGLLIRLKLNGRGGQTRTGDPLLPKQVR